MIDLSIVTGTYNRLSHLQKMVASCRSSVGNLKYEIILVDGGSTDGTIGWCKSQHDVRLIEQGELLGGIIAFNAGCAAARGDYVAILNDDIEVVGDTLYRATDYLKANPWCGQVAFENKVVGTGDAKRQRLSSYAGLMYGQCCVTPRWLGDYAGWWGDEGMRTYGGDTRLSLRMWELGYPTAHVDGCAIIDHVVEDELRKINSGDPWKVAREQGKQHPDTARFQRFWRGRVPSRGSIVPACHAAAAVLSKADQGNLRTLRFKGMMDAKHEMRTALIDLLATFGPTRQVNRAAMMQGAKGGRAEFQIRARKAIDQFKPDLLILQAQRRNSFTSETVYQLRKAYPFMYIVNFDGDTHYPLEGFHFKIAKAVHLQCVVSPTLFVEYAEGGCSVAYWPIGIEDCYATERKDSEAVKDGPDVTFLGALYGQGRFPEAQFREDTVKALWNIHQKGEIDFCLMGIGWNKTGIMVGHSNEEHKANADLYSKSKMALSVSQTSGLWGYSSDRLYNICATGCPALVQRFEGMESHGFVDGESCITFSTIPEMLEKVRHYLKHPGERERVGAAGKKVVLSRHTWAHRVENLFAMIEMDAR